MRYPYGVPVLTAITVRFHYAKIKPWNSKQWVALWLSLFTYLFIPRELPNRNTTFALFPVRPAELRLFPFLVFLHLQHRKNPPRWFLIRNIWCAWIQKINTAKDAGIHWKQWEHAGIQHCDKKSAISNLAAWKYTYEEGWIESLWKEGWNETVLLFRFCLQAIRKSE